MYIKDISCVSCFLYRFRVEAVHFELEQYVLGRHLESQKNGNRLSRPVPVEIPGPVRSKSGNFRGGVVTDC